MNTLDWIGAIVLKNASVELDISPCVIRIEITEDIFSPYPLGYILFEDTPSTNIIGKMGGDGLVAKGEELSLAFLAKIGEYFQELQGFHVYKVESFSPDEPEALRQKINYKLYFSSRIFFTNEIIRVNRYYEDKLSSVVQQIAEGFLQIKLDTLEPTDRKLSIYFPKMTPVECITLCSARSMLGENVNEVNYVFYGDIDHKYHYVTLSKLMESEPVIGTYDYDGITVATPYGINFMGNGTINRSPMKYSALRYQIKPFSPIKNMVNGMYSSSLLEYDIIRRKYKKHKYNYSEEFKKTRHLVEKQIVSKGTDYISLSYLNPDTYPMYYSASQWIHDVNEPVVISNNSNNAGRDYMQKRRSLMQQINQMGLEVELPGNPVLKIGQTVFFGRPQIDFSGVNNPKFRNPFVTGKFLITRKTTILENSGANNTLGFNLKTVFSLRKDSDIGAIQIGGNQNSNNSTLGDNSRGGL